MCIEFLVARMQAKLCRSRPNHIKGWAGLLYTAKRSLVVTLWTASCDVKNVNFCPQNAYICVISYS